MECAVCQIRSNIGYCVECQILLCEQCSTKCEVCSKLMCVDHVHETDHGRLLCYECMEERDRKYAERKKKHDSKKKKQEPAEDLSFDALMGATEEGEEEEDEALVMSGYQPTPPWRLSLYAAGGGILISLVLLGFPGLAGLAQPWTSIITLFVAAIGVFWAVIGLRRKDEEKEARKRCWYGLGGAGAVVILAVVTLIIRPAKTEETVIESFEDGREQLSEDELERWRQEQLRRYE